MGRENYRQKSSTKEYILNHNSDQFFNNSLYGSDEDAKVKWGLGNKNKDYLKEANEAL